MVQFYTLSKVFNFVSATTINKEIDDSNDKKIIDFICFTSFMSKPTKIMLQYDIC